MPYDFNDHINPAREYQVRPEYRKQTKSSRRPWPEHFMFLAHSIAERSTCLRRKVGAVAVRDKRIIATGYNGAPRGLNHCAVTGCLREKLHIPSGERHELCRAVHAEQNVICQAAAFGISLDGADLYCTTYPCIICAKMLINCGIARIIYDQGYPDEMSAAFLDEAGIETKQFRVLISEQVYK